MLAYQNLMATIYEFLPYSGSAPSAPAHGKTVGPQAVISHPHSNKLSIGAVDELSGEVISARITTTPAKNNAINPKAHHSTHSIQSDFFM